MFRSTTIRWVILAAFLIVVGLWPAAVAPIVLAAAGASAVLAAIPGPLLVGLAVIAWLKHKPAPTKPATA
jgi:hypothetical protein